MVTKEREAIEVYAVHSGRGLLLVHGSERLPRRVRVRRRPTQGPACKRQRKKMRSRC